MNAQARLGQVHNIITMDTKANTIPFDPDSLTFPQRKDVPRASYGPDGLATAWVWGENDNVRIDNAPRQTAIV